MIEIPGYKVLKQLGRGGMATVYLAIQESVDREVALKVMSPALMVDPNFGERFQREARIAAKLQHRHVVGVHDVGKYNDIHYIAMEYLPGGSFHVDDGKPREPTSVLRVVREISTALAYAHSKGFVHRDVKPDNILLHDDGSSALTDFGIARATDSASRMTRTGAVIGTPHYMSPEQARGRPLDGRADLYSLGVVLFELLTGEVPFVADDPLAVGIMHISEPVPRMPHPLEPIQSIVDRMLAKLPEDRFQTGDELAIAISDLEIEIAEGQFPDLRPPDEGYRRRVIAESSHTERISVVQTPGPAMQTPGKSLHKRTEPMLGRLDESALAERQLSPAPVEPVIRQPQVQSPAVPVPNPVSNKAAPSSPDERKLRLPAEPTLGRIDEATVHAERRPRTLNSTASVASMPAKSRRRWPLWLLGFTVLLGVGLWLGQDQLRNWLPNSNISQTLDKAQAALSAGRLFEGSDNARDLYNSVLQADPDNQQARQGLQAVGQAILQAARSALGQRDFDSAKKLGNSARELLQGGAALEEFDRQLAENEQSHLKVEDLLTKADAALLANELKGPSGATSLFQKVLAVDASNSIALNGIKKVLELQTQAADMAIQSGDLSAAVSIIDEIASVSGNYAALPELRARLSAAQTNAMESLEKDIARAERHFKDGALTSPRTDNAVDVFRTVLARDPQNLRAQAGIKRVAAKLLDQARAALSDKKVDVATRLYTESRQLDPSQEGLRSIGVELREAAERRDIAAQVKPIDVAQTANIQKMLDEAALLAARGDLIDPPGNNAYDKYRSILNIDRNNAEASDGIKGLPERAKSLFEQSISAGRLSAAGSYLYCVQELSPKDAAGETMKLRLAQAWLAQAIARIDENKPDAATKALDSAKRLVPNLAGLAEAESRLKALQGG